MKLLIDTHVFLWYIGADDKLPARFLEEIRNPENQVFLSVVSLWEITIKYQIGKLPLPEPPQLFIPTERGRHLIDSLPLNEESVRYLANLPQLHRDPFDRMLICQAQANQMTLVTSDSAILQYSVTSLPQT
ncbi:MAG: type II toxin-antitoxin system VapC family toxin [Anaerolineales bacterium]|nr:type II toxin-antitoxin system VapC family toxin [Anaerolineales bacterium]MCB8939875.1 type II toxin-antitoxin system VapC family toxin [Ardenticatenaceae bacterium]